MLDLLVAIQMAAPTVPIVICYRKLLTLPVDGRRHIQQQIFLSRALLLVLFLVDFGFQIVPMWV